MTPADRTSTLSRFAPLALVLLGLAAYSNTFRAEFVFDDFPHIVESPLVRDLGYFVHPGLIAESGASGVAEAGLRSRPLSLLTFALNYRAHGLDVRGYHLANLLIHVCAGLLLFRLARRALALPLFDRSALRGRERGTAFFAAALFIIHPIQTQAVTYIVQRMASLAGLLCLLSLTAYLEFRIHSTGARRWVLYAVALLALFGAMLSKENAATFPVLVAAFELLFLAAPPAQRVLQLAPLFLAATWVPARIVAGVRLDPALFGSALETVRANTEVSRADYLFTQFGVVTTYLRLLLWPVGQNLDPERTLQTDFWSWPVALPFALVAGLAVFSLVAIRRSRTGEPGWRLVGFGMVWFFVALSIESTFIPIADLLVEHRLYLPSAGIFLAVAVLVHLAWPPTRWASRIAALALTVLLLAGATFARNETWRTRLSIWRDSTTKSPTKPRPRILYAGALAEAGRTSEAIAEYRKAVEHGPKHFRAWTNLGNLLLKQHMPEEALAAFDGAIAAEPNDVFAHNGRGIALRALGLRDQAVAAYREALRLDPSYANARNNLGNVLRESGRPDLAIVELEIALRQAPDQPIIAANLEQARREAAERSKWSE